MPFYKYADYEALFQDAKQIEGLDILKLKYVRQVAKEMLVKLDFCSGVKMRAYSKAESQLRSAPT